MRTWSAATSCSRSRASATTKRDGVTLKDYVAGLKANQTAIYYLTAEDAAKAAASPQLEGLQGARRRSSAPDRSGRFLLGAHRAGIRRQAVQVGDARDGRSRSHAARKGSAARTMPTRAPLRRLSPSSSRRSAIRLRTCASQRASPTAPSASSPSDQALDRTLEKLLARQGTTDVKVSKPVLEINAGHALIQALAATAKTRGACPELGEASGLLLDLARVMDGEQVADPAKFAGTVCTLMQRAYAAPKA